MKTRLEEHYYKNIHPIMIDKFNYKNKFEIPKLTKVVINIGVGEAVKDSKKIDAQIKEISELYESLLDEYTSELLPEESKPSTQNI